MKKFLSVICICFMLLHMGQYSIYARSFAAEQLPVQFDLVISTRNRIVYITPYGKRYHTKDCTRTKELTLTTVERARAAGYTQCSYCKP